MMKKTEFFVQEVRPNFKGEKIFIEFDRGMSLMIFDDGQIFRWLEGAQEWEKLNITAG